MRLKVGDSVVLKRATIFGRYKRGDVGVVEEIYPHIRLLMLRIDGVRVACIREDVTRRRS
jgi:hypothetical protein